LGYTYTTQVARFPDDSLGIIILSNDNAVWRFFQESAKFRIAEEILGSRELDWNERYAKKWNKEVQQAQQVMPRSATPKPPNVLFTSLSFSHPTYGMPCLVPASVSCLQSRTVPASSHLIQCSTSSSPQTSPFRHTSSPGNASFLTHLRLTHFHENLFNVTVIWSNTKVREEYFDGEGEARGDFVTRLDVHFDVEWVPGKEKEGFLEYGELDVHSPGGIGKESAEVWFRVCKTVAMYK